MSLMRMIRGEWKIPSELVERGEVIRKRIQELNANIVHTFREANSLTDLLAKEVRQKPSTSLKDQNEENHDSELKAAKIKSQKT
ncbi:hypothetical protein H5410_031058, partial [Solanum commersonii]